MIKIKGNVKKIFFKNIGFSTGLLRNSANGKLLKFVGNFCARKNEDYVFCGKYIHGKFNKQFKVEYIDTGLKIEKEGLSNYLTLHPCLKGIGPKWANKIVNEFDDNFEKVLLENPKKIANFAKIPLTSVEAFKTDWEKSLGWNQVYTWLAGFNLSYFQIKSIALVFKSESVRVLQNDPYSIIDQIKGFSFIKTDEIALKIGFDKTHPSRLLGALKHAVTLSLKQGHCWIEGSALVSIAKSLLVLDDINSNEILEKALKEAITEDELAFMSLGKKGIAIGLPEILEKEQTLAKIFENQGVNPHFKKIGKINEVIKEHSTLELNDEQKNAVKAALEANVSIISGGAGTGKTYTLKALCKIFDKKGLKLKMAAPTGKAARRIEEVTGVKASTLHRLMRYNGFKFGHEKKQFKINTDILIVDEISMVDVELFWHLFQSLNLMKTSLVLVGDHNQLPPVGPGNILRDLMLANAVAITVLKKVMRHAGTLKENSSAILDGRIERSNFGLQRSWYLEDFYSTPEKIKERLLDMYDHRFNDLGYHIRDDVQILSPTHKGPIGTAQLNLDIRRVIQKKLFNIDIKAVSLVEGSENDQLKPKFYLNDKVIQTVNDYNNDVMNGEIGFIKNIDSKENIEVIFADGKIVLYKKNTKAMSNLQLAYCLSIHKVQGSQFPCVVSIIHRSHMFIHHRNLLYTAVTRAEKTAMILGDKWGIKNCVKKKETENRRTFLGFFMPPN